ncbi:quinone oxidoreductase [Tanacetum coccineum]
MQCQTPHMIKQLKLLIICVSVQLRDYVDDTEDYNKRLLKCCCKVGDIVAYAGFSVFACVEEQILPAERAVPVPCFVDPVVADINVASRIVEDMSGDTLDDVLFERYKRSSHQQVRPIYMCVFGFHSITLKMVSQGVKPNTVTYNTLIDAYGKAKRRYLEQGYKSEQLMEL